MLIKVKSHDLLREFLLQILCQLFSSSRVLAPEAIGHLSGAGRRSQVALPTFEPGLAIQAHVSDILLLWSRLLAVLLRAAIVVRPLYLIGNLQVGAHVLIYWRGLAILYLVVGLRVEVHPLSTLPRRSRHPRNINPPLTDTLPKLQLWLIRTGTRHRYTHGCVAALLPHRLQIYQLISISPISCHCLPHR